VVSEVMLQQTQAARVVPAYRRFVRRFPSVQALAATSRADVVRAWAGLGYNRRAVALHEAARAIVREHGGRVPSTVEALRGLTGVGPYTAAAVASMAFGAPVPAVDTNVARVIGRVSLGIDGADRREVEVVASELVDRRYPGEWNQAVMDLGREVCRPVPRCDACPLARTCRFRRTDAPIAPPRRRQLPFEGSTRQLRGAVVRYLRQIDSATVETLATATGRSEEDVVEAARALARDGLARVDPGATPGQTVVRL
jgi:A/G-specific adenine glycosylase